MPHRSHAASHLSPAVHVPARVACALLAAAIGILGPLPAGAGEWTGEEQTIDGELHVLNPAEPTNGIETIALQELWRIGGDTDDDDEFFGMLTDVVVDDAGNVYLLDAQLSEVRIFTADGEYLNTIGREGEGPGEFRRPSSLFLLPEGTVGVLQRVPGKIVLLGVDGKPRGEHPIPAAADGGFQGFVGGKAVGRDIVLMRRRRVMGEGTMEITNSLIRINSEGTQIARYTDTSTMNRFANLVIEERNDGFGSTWDVGADGRVYVSDTFDAYLIKVFAPDGKLDRVIEREYVPRVRSEEKKAEIRARFRPFGRRRAQAEFEVSDTDRDIQRLYPHNDGSLWVLSSRGAFDSPEGTIGTFDVIDAAGRFQRQVVLEGDGNAERDGFHFVGDRLYVVTGLSEAILAMRGGGGDESSLEEEEPEPMAVICYALGDGDALN